MKRRLPNAAATEGLAEALFAAMAATADGIAGWTVLLAGELGAGKSTFARAYIRAAGHAGTVPSPTYTLVEPYQLPCGKIYHIDLYRISDPEELRYLGWDEFDEGLRLVEWPERAPDLAAVADLLLQMEYDGDARVVQVDAVSGRGRSLIQQLGTADDILK